MELLSYVKNLTVHLVRQVFFDAHMLMSAVGANDEQLTMKVMESLRDYVRYGVQLVCQAPSSPSPPPPPHFSPCFNFSSKFLSSLWSQLVHFSCNSSPLGMEVVPTVKSHVRLVFLYAKRLSKLTRLVSIRDRIYSIFKLAFRRRKTNERAKYTRRAEDARREGSAGK